MTAAADPDIRILSESRVMSDHLDIEEWGAIERARQRTRELAGLGRRAAADELHRRQARKGVLTTLVAGFACTFAILLIASLTMENACMAAYDRDPYSHVTRICASHGLAPAPLR